MTRDSRAQASLELLAVLAALIGTLAVLAPRMQEANDAARELLTTRQEQQALSTVAGLIREAHALGEGTRLEGQVFLPAQTQWKATEGKLKAEFRGRNARTLEEELGFSLELEEGELAAGAWMVFAENRAGIRVEFARKNA